MVEQQLQALTREYELEKQQYNDLSNKHQAAVLAEDLERKRGGEQFTVLYPASYPLAPSKPDRGRIMLMSIVLGLVLGAGSALGREYLDPAVHDARALEDLDIPVLAEIPHIDRAA